MPFGMAPPKKVPTVAHKHSITGTAAVKMISPSGGMTVYAIWDANQKATADFANSVDEVVKRYPPET